MSRLNLVALLHAFSGAGSLIASLYPDSDLLAPIRFIRPIGLAVFAMGMLLFAVAIVYLKKAFLGEIEPVTDALVTTGPYRFVRHPLYLGMFLATIGLAVAFRSLWGMVIALVVFVPAGLVRAKLEERALSLKFGQEWEKYAQRTHFLLPMVC